MGWTRKARRATPRNRRPDCETLESRELLTASHGHVELRHGHAEVARLKTHPKPADVSIGVVAASSPSDLDGAAQTRATYGVNGAGMTVAVIDTGVNYDNDALGSGFGAGHKVVAGYDFADNDGNPIATSQHGTAVAGLIASSDPNHPGVAPGADLAALRVFNNSNQGNFDEVVSALQWVLDNHTQYNITAVNLSMSDGNNYAQNWFSQDGGYGQQITSLIGQLDGLNIPVIAATGNSFSGQQGEGFPAIISDTISVTSTNAAGTQISSTAQRLSPAVGGAFATDLAAPGEGLTAPADGNNFDTVEGTSFAAPQVTGAVVLLQQIYESRFGSLPTVAQLDGWLQQGSDPVVDSATNTTYDRLDIAKAAALIPTAQAQVLNPPSSGGTASNSGSVTTTVTGTSTSTGSGSTGNSGATSTGSTGGASSSGGDSSDQGDSDSAPPPANQGTEPTAVVNGMSLDEVDQGQLSQQLGSVFSVVSKALTALSGWGSSLSSGKVQIWTHSSK
jgi:subtilisin family serine protease